MSKPILGVDQMPEELRRTVEIERQKDQKRSQKEEDQKTTDKIEELKRKGGGAL